MVCVSYFKTKHIKLDITSQCDKFCILDFVFFFWLPETGGWVHLGLTKRYFTFLAWCSSASEWVQSHTRRELTSKGLESACFGTFVGQDIILHLLSLPQLCDPYCSRAPHRSGRLRLKQILDSGVRRTGFPERSPSTHSANKAYTYNTFLLPQVSLKTPTTRGDQCFTNGKFRSVSVKVRHCLGSLAQNEIVFSFN